ncbi:MAG: hypothetical protein NVS4B6_17070 [Mycobacterium sp.]
MLLLTRDLLQDRTAGLALGGDDYVTKPFSLDDPRYSGSRVGWREASGKVIHLPV